MISEVIISDNVHKCCVCGKPTQFIEINYQAPFCSDECVAEMDRQSNADIQRVNEELSSMNEEEFDNMLKQCGIEEIKPSIESDYNKALII